MVSTQVIELAESSSRHGIQWNNQECAAKAWSDLDVRRGVAVTQAACC